MEQAIFKDGEVEVCSEEEGFQGAWFKAILEENPTKSGRKKLTVRYLTLLDEAGSTPLKEVIEQKFIRPVPPVDLYDGVDLVEGSVVDADHKDGWWTGVVLKKSEDESFLVYFDSPPDIIEFERKQLRANLEWTGWKWVRPEIKELDKSMLSSGTIVELSSVIDDVEVAWLPVMVIKEVEVDEDGEKTFIVKRYDKQSRFNGDDVTPNDMVASSRIRPTPPPVTVEQYKVLERVEAFVGSGWRQGLVRRVLTEKIYEVMLEATKLKSMFKHSDLRPYMVWEDNVWHQGSKRNTIKETVIKTKPLQTSSVAKPMIPSTPKRRTLNPEETVAATGELGKKKADPVVMNDKPTKSTALSPVTPSLTTPPLKQTEAETKGKNDSTQQKMHEEKNSEDKSGKRKREEEHNSENDETCIGSMAEDNDTSKRICEDDDDHLISTWIGYLSDELSPCQTPNVVNHSAAGNDVEATQAKGIMTSPFVKKSPYWKTCESTERFKSLPQHPHFRPLFEGREDNREFSAVGMMVTFYGLLDEVIDIRLDDSTEKLNSLIESFTELEKHGFNVAMPQSRIRKVLSLKEGRGNKAEERNGFENKIAEEEKERLKFEDERVEIKRKILELKRRETAVNEKDEAAVKKIGEMKSSVAKIVQEIEDVELAFQKFVSAPW